MPATLTATAEPSNSPPRVRLDITLPAGGVGVSAYVTRVGSDGRTVPVRLADPTLVTGSSWVGYDYEAPYGALCTYSAQVVYYVSGSVNLATNPACEVDITGWLSNDTYPFSHTTAAPIRGAGSAMTTRSSSTPSIIASEVYSGWPLRVPVVAGQPFTMSVTVRGEQPNRSVHANIEYYTPAGASFEVSTTTITALPDGVPTRVTATSAAVPEGAATARLTLSVWSTNAIDALTGERVWYDDLLAGPAGPYFDGDTPDGALAYAWAGAPHASTSTATSTMPLTETTTATATVDVSDVWLVHPGIPDLSMRLDKVTNLGDRVRPVKRGIFEPYGRELPLVVTDGRRKAAQASLTIRTRTLGELAALVALMADAATLLLNVPQALGWGLTNEYISLGDLAESRETATGDDPCRLFTAPYHVTGRPIGGSQSQRTYADLLAEFATYQAVLDAYASYSEVLAPTT